MSNNKTPSKIELIKAIEKLENDQSGLINFYADLGVGAVGLVAGGSAAAILGGSTLLFGLVTVAAPLGVVVGGAALGGLALVGVKKLLFDGTKEDGKKEELLNSLKEKLKQVEAKTKESQVEESDIRQFVVFLKQPIQLDLISPEKAQQLISAIKNGHISLTEGYKLVQDIMST